MGDLAELRGLITATAFFSCFVILVAVIPSEFLLTSSEYRQIETPEYFDSVNIQSFSSTINFTLDGSDPLQYGWYIHTFTVSGWELRLLYRTEPTNPSLRGIQMLHAEYWWVFLTGYHNMKIYDLESGEYIGYIPPNHLTLNKMLQYYNDDTDLLKVRAKCDHATISVFMAFNTTKFDDIAEAFLAHELSVLVGVGFDQVNTSINAWNLMMMILFFQMPQVHPVINALIAIPMWVCIGYLIYVLILKAIPFVGD